MTPSAPQPGYGGGPGYQQPMRSGGGFMSGLMGGLIGAGIGGLLFGHGFMGGGMGIFGFLGMLLQLFLLFIVVRWVYRLVTGGRSPAMAGGPGIFAQRGMPGSRAGAAGFGRAAGRSAADSDRSGRLPAVRAIAAGHPGRLERA